MWTYFRGQVAHGRMPTGAELDRAAGTNNYGRRVLRQWHEKGRIPSTAAHLRQQEPSNYETETSDS